MKKICINNKKTQLNLIRSLTPKDSKIEIDIETEEKSRLVFF